MAIITLTSDWGLKDPYCAAVKGAILSQKQDVTIIDISHEIPVFEIEQAAMVIKSVWQDFPEGTVHIIGINTEESSKFAHTVVEAKGQFFIGTDNGIFSMLFDEKPESVIELTIPQDSDVFTFSTRDRFVKAAIHLANGKPLSDLGTPKESFVEKILLKPVLDQNILKGHVIYIDRYENVITNITRQLFNDTRDSRKFNIVFRSHEIDMISDSYTDVAPGEIVALFDSAGFLEIAINQGNAAGLLGLSIKNMVRIEFS